MLKKAYYKPRTSYTLQTPKNLFRTHERHSHLQLTISPSDDRYSAKMAYIFSMHLTSLQYWRYYSLCRTSTSFNRICKKLSLTLNISTNIELSTL